MIRRSPIRKRRVRPRRGRVVDRDYLSFMATQPCLVSGSRNVTLHHVRFCGSPKDDRRVVPLAPEYHLIQHGPYTSIEALGKAKFQERYGVDLEAAIRRYNSEYDKFSCPILADN
jgi:hypothetical protein